MPPASAPSPSGARRTLCWTRRWGDNVKRGREIAVGVISMECQERFPRQRLRRKPLVSDPGMHTGACLAHVPSCLSGSLTRSGRESVPGIPGACATLNFTYLTIVPWSGTQRIKNDKKARLNFIWSLHNLHSCWCMQSPIREETRTAPVNTNHISNTITILILCMKGMARHHVWSAICRPLLQTKWLIW